MKTLSYSKQNQATTLVELIVILAVAVIFAVLFISLRATPTAQLRARRVGCLFNLKQIGLAEKSWADDHGGDYPMQVSETNGGTMEFATGANAFRHFQVMSNELTRLYIVHCPSDNSRPYSDTTNFDLLSNSNLSYFVSLDAVRANAQMLLSGDRNITDGASLNNGIMTVTTNRPIKWTAEIHRKAGNILLADGSAQQVDSTELHSNIVNAGTFSNRLLMPILNP